MHAFTSHVTIWACYRFYGKKPDYIWLSIKGRWVAKLQSLFLNSHYENSGVANQKQNERNVTASRLSFDFVFHP